MTTKPNILFILSDDQGIWAASCYGNPEIRTPNLDRIAATGMRFDNFFVATPVCSPSRATFLTGRISSQHGVHDWIRGGNVGEDAACYLQNEVSYTDILAAHGWTCGLSGKWHLGHSQLPQHGFSHWFTHQEGGGPYNNAPMVRNGELTTSPGYITDVITDDALAFIERQANDTKPFYLSVHYTAPHSPWTGHPQTIVDSYDDCPFDSCPQESIHPWAIGHALTENSLGNREMLKGYFAAVTAMDENIGRLLNKLDALGISDNTLVVFVSDNGFSCGHNGFWCKGNATYPPNMFDNSVKVPMLMCHPGHIPAATVQTALCSAYDFMPTLLDYLKLPLPTDRNLPGQSFSALLQGKDLPGRDAVVVYDEYGSTRMARTAEWKYVHRYPDGPHELYDLKNDSDERQNLINNPAYSDRLRQMLDLLEEWFERYVEQVKDGRNYAINGSGQRGPINTNNPNDHSLFANQ